MSNRSLDDLNPGDVFKSYGRTVTETDIVNFTCLAGLKLPIFINEEFAKKHTDFGGRICPGLLTASIAAGMMETASADLELVEGNVRIVGVPGRATPLAQIAQAVTKAVLRQGAPGEGVLAETSYFIPPTVTYASACHAAVVSVE